MKILIVDDDEDDRFQLRRLLQACAPQAEILELRDGEEVVPFLARVPDVHLIFLDLRMVRMDGLEVLEELLATDHRAIPVVVLTTSDFDEDVNTAYYHKAALYLRKPADMEGLALLFSTMTDFAIQIIRLPQRRE